MLDIDRHQGLMVLRLRRPARGNALDAELVAALSDACAAAAADEGLHTLAVWGEGPHLCTGFDLGDLDAQTDASLLLRFVQIEQLLADLWQAPLRTAARATGRTWGAGADLFVACDRRTAVAGTSFRFPGAGFGLVLGTGRLAERVGADRALRWVAEGATLDADHAVAHGLADEIAADESTSDAWLERLAVPPAVDRRTHAGLKRATRSERRDADLAALVRSAARPGLQQRIVAYRQSQLTQRRDRASRAPIESRNVPG